MLEAVRICKTFPGGPVLGKPVLNQISMMVEDGEFLTLLGPSGCGKTTFLRCIAGLEIPDQGDLMLDGKSFLKTTPQQRPFHMVFQRYALFPTMNVAENIEFSLRIKKVDPMKRKARVQELLDLMQLSDFGQRRIESLSGGQTQRIALARALADQPRLLLLDEPFSALDEKIKIQLRAELKSLQKKLGLTFLFVTHDQQEALQLSDRIALFHQGGIEQIGTPEQLVFEPKTFFTAEFLGQKNLVKKESDQGHYLLPEKIQLGHQGEIKLQGRVQIFNLVGPYYEVRALDDKGYSWVFYINREQSRQLQVQENILFSYNSADVIRVQSHSPDLQK